MYELVKLHSEVLALRPDVRNQMLCRLLRGVGHNRNHCSHMLVSYRSGMYPALLVDFQVPRRRYLPAQRLEWIDSVIDSCIHLIKGAAPVRYDGRVLAALDIHDHNISGRIKAVSAHYQCSPVPDGLRPCL